MNNNLDQQLVYAVLPAAGSGTRMGSDKPKVLLPLGETTILEKALSVFLSEKRVHKLIVLAPKGYLSDFQSLIFDERVSIVEGGSSREESVRIGIDLLKDLGASDKDYVLIHDAARCFLDQDLLTRVINTVFQKQAVTTAIRQSDSLKRVKDLTVQESVDRSELWAIQTPQAFRVDLIQKAHATRASLEGSTTEATDDSVLIEPVHPVTIVEGSTLNFKITTPSDYELAKLLSLR